jgi:hypothetical protein
MIEKMKTPLFQTWAFFFDLQMVNYEIMKFSLPMVKFTFLVIEFDFKVLLLFIKCLENII